MTWVEPQPAEAFAWRGMARVELTDDDGSYRRTQARVPFLIGLWCACVLLQRTATPAGRVRVWPVHVTNAPLILCQIGREPIAHACADARHGTDGGTTRESVLLCRRAGLMAPRTRLDADFPYVSEKASPPQMCRVHASHFFLKLQDSFFCVCVGGGGFTFIPFGNGSKSRAKQ